MDEHNLSPIDHSSLCEVEPRLKPVIGDPCRAFQLMRGAKRFRVVEIGWIAQNKVKSRQVESAVSGTDVTMNSAMVTARLRQIDLRQGKGRRITLDTDGAHLRTARAQRQNDAPHAAA